MKEIYLSLTTIPPRIQYINELLTDFINTQTIKPTKIILNIPTKYNRILQNKTIFPDIRKIIEDILNGNVTSHLDFSNCLYINKCKILGLNIITFNELIKILRVQ
mgnify:CR=1 FL=1